MQKHKQRVAGNIGDKHLEECSSHVNKWDVEEKDSLTKVEKKKNPKNRLTTQHTLFIGEPEKGQIIDPPIHISDELLTVMKTMSPQDLKNTLIKPGEQQEEVELTDMEEYDLTGSGEPVYETPIMTPQLYRRIMANEFSQDQVEYIIKKSLHF